MDLIPPLRPTASFPRPPANLRPPPLGFHLSPLYFPAYSPLYRAIATRQLALLSGRWNGERFFSVLTNKFEHRLSRFQLVEARERNGGLIRAG